MQGAATWQLNATIKANLGNRATIKNEMGGNVQEVGNKQQRN